MERSVSSSNAHKEPSQSMFIDDEVTMAALTAERSRVPKEQSKMSEHKEVMSDRKAMPGVLKTQSDRISTMPSTEILNFIEHNTIKCQQKDQQWHELRRFSVGGSEIAKLLDGSYVNFMRQSSLLESKTLRLLNQEEPFGNIVAMNWGNFVEPIHRAIIEFIFGTTVVETGLAVGKKSLKFCHQSPDGLATIDSAEFYNKCTIHNKWKDFSVFKKERLNVLFEQKAPASRKCATTVPQYYIQQVLLGLSMFECCDIGCFSDISIRFCSFEQLATAEFNANIIPDQPPQAKAIKYAGFTVIQPKSNDLLQQSNSGIDITDILTQYNITDFLVQESYVFPWDNNTLNTMKQAVLERNPQFIVFWKCDNVTFIAVEKQQYFGQFAGLYSALFEPGLRLGLEQNEYNINNFNNLTRFTSNMSKLRIPLQVYNEFDDWFLKNRPEIIRIFTQSIYITEQCIAQVLSLLAFNDPKGDKQAKFMQQMSAKMKQLGRTVEWSAAQPIPTFGPAIESIAAPDVRQSSASAMVTPDATEQ